MTEMAKKAGFEIFDSSLEVKFVPDTEDLRKSFEFGKQIAIKIKS